METPCRNCTEREQGCRSHCIAYRKWKAEHDQIVARMKQDDAANREMEGQVRRKTWRS